MNSVPNQGGRMQQNIGGLQHPQLNQQQQADGNGKNPKKSKFNGTKVAFLVMVVAIVIFIIAIIAAIVIVGNNITSGSVKSQINKNEYQAVFLNNADGQVYFGKLQDLNKGTFKLTDIYYVKVDKTIQPGQTNNQSNISLAKLGSEIHAPEDVMYINKNSVMFWENLKPSGQVVKAIIEYQKNPTPASTQQTPAKQ